MRAPEIDLFCQHLRTRNYSAHTVANYELDLHLFFEAAGKTVARITWRDVDRFIEQQYEKGLAATTINRRLHALKRFYDFLVIDGEEIASNPVKPSHYLRQGRPLPKKLTPEQVRRLFEQIESQMDRALFLLMLRCGLRVSEVAQLKVADVDWDQQAIWVEQGKGRKDRVVYLSADALTSLKECQAQRPKEVASDYFFWNQKRCKRPLSVKAIQKKIERYARSAGIKASCHSLRHTFASNLLEEGAAIVSIKEFLGHSSIAASERYARLSNQQVKQTYLQAIKKVIARTKV